MPRYGVTQEQVYEAAAAMVEEGTTPTVMLVRNRIGGSPNTITPFLRAWREEHTGKAPANVPDIPETVRADFEKAWRTASMAAQAELDTERRALEAMRREMEQDQADMGAEIDRLETALEDAEKREAGLSEKLSDAAEAGAALAEQNKNLSIENARLEERANAAEQGRAELKEQLERLQGTFEAATKAIQSAAPRRKPRTKAGAGGEGEPKIL